MSKLLSEKKKKDIRRQTEGAGASLIRQAQRRVSFSARAVN